MTVKGPLVSENARTLKFGQSGFWRRADPMSVGALVYARDACGASPFDWRV